MIHAREVTHHFGVRPVLSDVDFQAREGELVALMGPNGAGKSTLMAVLAGVLSPWQGWVEVAGVRRRSSPEAELEVRRKVAYLPADPWLPLGQTGRAWVLAVGRVYGVEGLRLFDHVDRLLALFELTAVADSPMSSYSTGQRKKAALCCALVAERPVLLLDEPFSGGLDPSGILAVKRLLLHLVGRRQATVVIATPVPELVEGLADRVAVLKGGRIVAAGTVDELRRQADCAGGLDEAYERIVSPERAGAVDAYFRGERT